MLNDLVYIRMSIIVMEKFGNLEANNLPNTWSMKGIQKNLLSTSATDHFMTHGWTCKMIYCTIVMKV